MSIKTTPSIPFMFKLIIALIAFCIIFFLSMILGAANISVNDLWLALSTNSANNNTLIIGEIRLPRVIAAALVGAGFSVSGAIMQGLTRNPLADPGLLGLTAGANAALTMTIIFLPSINYFGNLIACFFGAAIGVFLVFGICSLKKGGFSTFRIVLAGAVISSFLFALAETIAIYFKVSREVAMWTSGGLIGTTWTQIQVITPVIIVGLFAAIFLSKELTVLSLSEEVAIGLGQQTKKVKTFLFIIIILLSGASVALVGRMAFIGLMIPHIVRTITGKDYRFIIPMCAIMGGILMMFADTIGRTINAPFETPVAAILAIIGLPFFLFIVHRGGSKI